MSSKAAVKNVATQLLERTRRAGDELRQGIEDVRSEIRTLNRQRSDVMALPPTVEVAFERVDTFLNSLGVMAKLGSPTPDRFATGNYVKPESVNPVDLIVAYMAPVIGDVMKGEIERLYEQRPGITEQDRDERLAKIDRQLLDCEMTEESIIRAAENAGFTLSRRRNANPIAVLATDEALP